MFKLIKKILIVPLFFVGIILVFGEDCEPIIEPISNGNKICHESKSTVINYEYPKGIGNFKKTFENNYCRVDCKEFISISYPSIRKVYSGQGFSYPLYVSANRSCKAAYKNVEDFDKLYRKMISAYMVLVDPSKPRADVNGDGLMDNKDLTEVNSWKNTLLTLDGRKILNLPNRVTALYNEINNMKNLKIECNEWGEETDKYSLNPIVDMSIATSEGTKEIKYVFKETEYSNTKTESMSNESSCKLGERVVSGKKELFCIEEETIISWDGTFRIDGSYTMPNVSLELYTGKVIENPARIIRNGECIAGNTFFTKMNEKTRPALGDKIDKGYPLTLTVKSLGSIKSFDLTVNCFYQVMNLTSLIDSEDSVYSYYKNFVTPGEDFSLHEYRIIDLEEPFPNRQPLANWIGSVKVMVAGKERIIPLREYYITEQGTTIRSNNLYTIRLNNSSVRAVSNYNKSNPYGVFNLDKNENSVFIRKNTNIVEKGSY